MKRTMAVTAATMAAVVAGVSPAMAAGLTAQAPVTYAGASVDGNPGEWSSPVGTAIPMYEAGDPGKVSPSSAFLRYDCTTQTMNVLVRANAGAFLVDMNTAAWATINGEAKKRYTGASGDDGTPPDFAWIAHSPAESVAIGDTTYHRVDGYEASFPLAPGHYDNLVIHTEFAKSIVDGSGAAGTSANVGFAKGDATTLDLNCSGQPPVVEHPGVSLVKSTNGADANDAPGPYVRVGSAVDWAYEVTNTGDVSLSNLVVTDDQGVAVTCPATTLAVGAGMSCTGSGTATIGQYANVGTVTGTSPSGVAVTDDDASHYFGVADLTAAPTSSAGFTRTFSWAIDKTSDKALVKQVGGSATFAYTVSVTQSGYSDGEWAASGEVTLANPNTIEISGVVATVAVDNGGDCTVTDGTGLTLAGGQQTVLEFDCTWASAPTSASGTATSSVTWQSPLAGSASATSEFAFGEPTAEVDRTVAVTDTYAGDLGTVTGTTTKPFAAESFTYDRTIGVPADGCRTYGNTATITDTGQSASRDVTVCGPARTGALTMGFWQNKNGQSVIKSGSTLSGVSTAGTWLRQYAPFQDLPEKASASDVAEYATKVIKSANARGASMNAMLKAQMLATSLDVYFSDPALGGNQIGAPGPVGAVLIDVTQVCTDLRCVAYEDSSSVFGGSPTATVQQMLTLAAAQSNPGGSSWYGNVKATQELAKDAFDAINNQAAFTD